MGAESDNEGVTQTKNSKVLTFHIVLVYIYCVLTTVGCHCIIFLDSSQQICHMKTREVPGKMSQYIFHHNFIVVDLLSIILKNVLVK